MFGFPVSFLKWVRDEIVNNPYSLLVYGGITSMIGCAMFIPTLFGYSKAVIACTISLLIAIYGYYRIRVC